MKGTISVNRAIWTGRIIINVPVAILIGGPLWLFGDFVKAGVISRSYNWLGFIVLGVSFSLAWLWWSISVPRWRLWAYKRVHDINALKQQAIAIGLTWPIGHPLQKTEIDSQAHVQRERDFEWPGLLEQAVNHSLTILHNRNGWAPVSVDMPNSENVIFNFYISRMADDKLLLSALSEDNSLFDDCVHETMAEAKECAEEIWRVDKAKWENVS